MKITVFEGDYEIGTCTLDHFLAANADDPLPPEEVAAIRGLEISGTHTTNLGAGGTFSVLRVE